MDKITKHLVYTTHYSSCILRISIIAPVTVWARERKSAQAPGLGLSWPGFSSSPGQPS